MSTIAVVPARGGSKGIINKNLQEIYGKSLVEIAVGYALRSQVCEKIILSTDSLSIASKFLDKAALNEFQKMDVNGILQTDTGFLIHKRSAKYATSEAKTIDVILEIMKYLNHQDTDYILLLQPTSPFRSTVELRQLLEKVDESGAKSCISAKRFDSPHPDKRIRVNKGRILLEENTLRFTTTPRQQLDSYHVFDGAFYLTQAKHLRSARSFIESSTLIFEREGLWTINIDNEEDLEFARFIAQKRPWMLKT